MRLFEIDISRSEHNSATKLVKELQAEIKEIKNQRQQYEINSPEYKELTQKMRSADKKIRSIKTELDNSNITFPEFNSLMSAVNADCKYFLQEAGNLKFNLYRGMHGEQIGAKLSTHLTDRKISDTKPMHHKLGNAYFTEKFGHPYRNALFAIGDPSYAHSYGSVYNIFPIGQFDFVWSESTEDFTVDVGDTETEDEYVLDDLIQLIQTDPANSEKYKQDIKYIFDRLGYRTGDLQAAISSGHEIMIWCKEYYAINSNALNEYI